MQVTRFQVGHQVTRCAAGASDAARPKVKKAARRAAAPSIPRATLEKTETTMTLAEIEEDNARLKQQLVQLDLEEDAALEQLRAENELLRKLAFAKVKQLPPQARASFAERYQGLVIAGSREGLCLPTLPAELLSLTVEGEVPRAPVVYVEPAKAAPAASPKAAAVKPRPAPKAQAAPAPVAKPAKAQAVPVAAAPKKAPLGGADGWERYDSDDTEAYVRAEDASLTFRFGEIMSTLKKKITGA